MTVALVDYGSGNLHSAAKAFERVARECDSQSTITVTSDPEMVAKAARIVLPGVGAFRDCRDGLRAIPGLWDAIDEAVTRKGTPFLGICVGMQLMAERGLEHVTSNGFGWIAGDVVRLQPADPAFNIPHMGWNVLEERRPHPLLKGLAEQHAYFVHSYHLAAARPDDIAASADYGGPVTAFIARDNMAGSQFHPEKSQAVGLALIGNFLTWSP